jgi:hypothetical protein
VAKQIAESRSAVPLTEGGLRIRAQGRLTATRLQPMGEQLHASGAGSHHWPARCTNGRHDGLVETKRGSATKPRNVPPM